LQHERSSHRTAVRDEYLDTQNAIPCLPGDTSEEKPSTEIGRILGEAREKKGLTLRAVEVATGISNPLISQIESGHIKPPSFKNVIKLCDVYAIPLKRLINEAN
jgi:hypothetical protein